MTTHNACHIPNIVHIIEMFVNSVQFPYELGLKAWLNCNGQDGKDTYLTGSASTSTLPRGKPVKFQRQQLWLWYSRALSSTHRDLILKNLLLKDNSMDFPVKFMSLDLPKLTKVT